MSGPLDGLVVLLGEIIRLAGSDQDRRDDIIMLADSAVAVLEELPPPTPRQRELLAFAGAWAALAGSLPSYAEIAGGLGLASKSGVHRLLKGLQARGLVRLGGPGHPRAFRLLGDPPP